MNLVFALQDDKNLMEKLELFQVKSKKKLSFINDLKTILNNGLNNDSIQIYDLVYCEKNAEIENICYFKGNKDNRLIELEIVNLHDNCNKKNIDFINLVTNYAFINLNAETVTIISNQYNKNNLISIGYEYLGKKSDIDIYIKDREKHQEIGVVKK